MIFFILSSFIKKGRIYKEVNKKYGF